MNITPELTPWLLSATLGFLVWRFLQVRQREKQAIYLWLQGLLLLLPWISFLGLQLVRIRLSLAGWLLLLVGSTGLYIGVGSWIRRQAPVLDPKVMPEAASDPLPPLKEEPLGLDLALIQSIFSLDSFYATEGIPYAEGAIFKGNLRTDPEQALKILSERLRQLVGDAYRLYLVEDPQEKPAVVVLPEAVVNQQQSSSGAKLLAVGLLGVSLFSLLEVGANLFGFRILEDPGRWLEALPIAAGLLAILGLHELGHRWQARKYGVRLSPPFMIPSFGIGTLGALTRIESPVPDRRALFDISLAGPAVGGFCSLMILLVGLKLSVTTGNIYLSTDFLQNSILVALLAKGILGTGLQPEGVALHPLVAVGWIGLAINALGLLPAGQLDGGRIVQAVYGRKVAGRTTFFSLLVLALGALANVVALYWALLILFVARESERPPQNEITETDEVRDGIALVALFWMALTLLPLPPVLAEWIGFPR